MMLDLIELCRRHTIEPRGVIHIGAHEGSELATYQKMGIRHILFVEANPVVFKRLQTNVAGVPGVRTVNCAISNQNGTATLYVTSMDQSSSIMPLKLHKELYPSIKETHQIQISSKRLDTLIEELHIAPSDYNILNIDIQGAELLAFQGATNLLKYIEAINTEVNYEELYEGCALIHQIDEFLNIHGFERISTVTPYHPSWGDAFYIRKSSTVKAPVVTMSSLGRNGRFANQLFQYAFLKIYAGEHNLRVETPEWIGKYLFGHMDPPISEQLPIIAILLPQDKITKSLPDALITDNPDPIFKNVSFSNMDFWGYFQFNTKYYAPYKDYFRSLFTPVPEIKMSLDDALNRLYSMGKTVVGLHLRRNDYGSGPFFIAPTEWYKEWLAGIWNSLNEPVLFIASDEPQKIISAFADYRPITSKDLGIKLPKAEYYPDFYLLSQCDFVAISNSSFSFAACMLNKNANLFVRPHLPSKKLIPFNPWDSEVLFYDDELIQSIEINLHRENLKRVNDLCKDILKTHPYDVIRFITMKINKSLETTDQPYDEAYYILAHAFNEIGLIDEAIMFYQKTLHINPNHIEARASMVNALKAKNPLKDEVMYSRTNRIYHDYPMTHLTEKFNIFNRGNNQLIDKSTFIICAMFTPHKPKLFQHANRLINSCEKFELPYCIYQVPSIHKSISQHGQDDVTFTKANFILYCLNRFKKNILYMDIDVFLMDYPGVITEISNSDYDFAIYNWISDIHNEAYMPLNNKLEVGNIYSDVYMFSHCIGYYSPKYLMCSGCVQFYKNSDNAKCLLECWQNQIAQNPCRQDDGSLALAFNSLIEDSKNMKAFWLDKSYCRYPWWPHIRPVIIHPQIPNPVRETSKEDTNSFRKTMGKCQPKTSGFIFPRDCIFDTSRKLLLKLVNDQIVDIKPLVQDFWIYPEDVELG
jgi:FkbM family methyltransferase